MSRSISYIRVNSYVLHNSTRLFRRNNCGSLDFLHCAVCEDFRFIFSSQFRLACVVVIVLRCRRWLSEMANVWCVGNGHSLLERCAAFANTIRSAFQCTEWFIGRIPSENATMLKLLLGLNAEEMLSVFACTCICNWSAEICKRNWIPFSCFDRWGLEWAQAHIPNKTKSCFFVLTTSVVLLNIYFYHSSQGELNDAENTLIFTYTRKTQNYTAKSSN